MLDVGFFSFFVVADSTAELLYRLQYYAKVFKACNEKSGSDLIVLEDYFKTHLIGCKIAVPRPRPRALDPYLS